MLQMIRYDESNKNIEGLKGNYGQDGQKSYSLHLIKNVLFIQLYDGCNVENVQLPTVHDGFLRTNKNTLDEVVRYKGECDYLFLSPIFDSISKRGYLSKFSHNELLNASIRGIIDDKVVALGGVTPDKLSYLKSLHFGGAAMLGTLDR